jgi:membrane associated rhomboid family serine protease
MFPLKDDNPTLRAPIITVLLIAINVLVYIYQYWILDPSAGQMFSVRFGFIPFELTHGTELGPGAHVSSLATAFSSMFMHGGLIHLGGNMLYLWIFGDNIEDALGHIGFLVFYLVAGLGALGMFVLTGPNTQVPLVGASGAISGVLGMYAFRFPKSRVLTLIFLGWFVRLIWIPAMYVLGIWFLMQILFGVTSVGSDSQGGVAYMAHVGGFLVGLAAAFVFRPARPDLPN